MPNARPQSLPGTDPRARSARWIGAALFVLTALLFARACGNGFVNYDDPDYVTANPHVQAGLGTAGARWAFTAETASNWHPLTWLSHMLDVSLFGRNAGGHHATSVLLHALSAALAFAALRRLTGALWTSALAAALFAWHPLRVESVAWVAERKDVLSGVFFFACLWAYAAYAERRRAAQPCAAPYVSLLVGFALGLMAKPMLVTLPCVLLLLDFWPLRRFGGALSPVATANPAADLVARPEPFSFLVLEKLPLFALAAASCFVTYHAQSAGGAVTAALSFDARVANAVVSVGRYLGLFLWPSNLAVLYPHPGHWPAGRIAVGIGIIVAFSWLSWRQRQHRPWILIGWLWFLGMLVPVIGLVQVGLQSIADRYTYLPGIGLELAVLWTAREFFRRDPARSLGTSQRATSLAGIGVLGGFALLTFAQLGVWKDSLTLFTHTIAVAGEGNYLAYDNRGIAWGDRGEVDKAVADYEHALAIRPDYPNANNNLGRVLAERGQLDAAIAHYRTALARAPAMLEVHNNLANALSDAGRLDEAIEHYQFVLQRNPNHVNALNGYGVALASKGQLAEAEREFRHVLEIEPDNTSAISNLGNVYAISGRRAEAEKLFERSLTLHPDAPRTLYNLGNVLSAKGDLSAALDMYLRAVKLAPTNPDAHAAAGLTLLRLGRSREAIPQLETALQLRPNSPQIQQWLEAARQAPAKR